MTLSIILTHNRLSQGLLCSKIWDINPAVGSFPLTRLRRVRMQTFARDLCRESNLIPKKSYTACVCDRGNGKTEAISSMPGVHRLSIDRLLDVAKIAVELEIPAIALFPVVGSSAKSLDAGAAWDTKGLIPTAVKALKENTLLSTHHRYCARSLHHPWTRWSHRQ